MGNMPTSLSFQVDQATSRLKATYTPQETEDSMTLEDIESGVDSKP